MKKAKIKRNTFLRREKECDIKLLILTVTFLEKKEKYANDKMCRF